MAASQTHFEITAAETKSIGFDYQYYYFLLQLLKMGLGKVIGLEVKDDVHLDLPDGKLMLIQLKHTTQEKHDGTKVNLKERDIDLWKTIYNWLSITKDAADGRKEQAAQLQFLKNTQFLLVSNKEEGSRNGFINHCKKLNTGNISIIEFKQYLDDLYNTTTDSDENRVLRSYILDLKKANNKLLTIFISKIVFDLSEDDLIEKIKNELRGFMIQPERIDDVYNALNSRLRDDIYLGVKSQSKTIISYEDFLTRYRVCFGTLHDLPIRRMEPILPDDLLAQVFVKQLVDIGDITTDEKEEIIRFTKQKLLMFNNLNTWIQKSELTETQKKNFIEQCIIIWKNSYRSAHRKNTSALNEGKVLDKSAISDAGITCLDELRKKALNIETQMLDMDISNGQFYLLSDDLLIGWHLEWEKIYKNKTS